jgi:hypothetical protein
MERRQTPPCTWAWACNDINRHLFFPRRLIRFDLQICVLHTTAQADARRACAVIVGQCSILEGVREQVIAA